MSTNIYNNKIPETPYNISITNWGMDGYCITINDEHDLEVVDFPKEFNGQEWIAVIQAMRQQGKLPKTAEMRAAAIEFTINYLNQFKQGEL